MRLLAHVALSNKRHCLSKIYNCIGVSGRNDRAGATRLGNAGRTHHAPYAGRQPLPTVLAGGRDCKTGPSAATSAAPHTLRALRDHKPQRRPKHNRHATDRPSIHRIQGIHSVGVRDTCCAVHAPSPRHRGSSRRSLRAALLVRLPAARAASRVKGPTY